MPSNEFIGLQSVTNPIRMTQILKLEVRYSVSSRLRSLPLEVRHRIFLFYA